MDEAFVKIKETLHQDVLVHSQISQDLLYYRQMLPAQPWM